MSPSAPLKNPDLEIQKEILELVHAIEKLRGPGGCPWDLEQNHQTLAPYALEEVCELLEALDTQNYKLMQEELGDVLFQVVLHSELAKESGRFTMADVIKGIREKIIRRHPHVFGSTQVNGTAEVLKNWEEIKKQEKLTHQKLDPKSHPIAKNSFSLPKQLPALSMAHKIGDKTQRSGFDWTCIEEVLAKLDEEVLELKEALKLKNQKDIEHEIGDVLFSTAQVARHLQLDAETALRKTNHRFEQRYFLMKELAEKDTLNWEKMTLNQKEEYWEKAKTCLKSL